MTSEELDLIEKNALRAEVEALKAENARLRSELTKLSTLHSRQFYPQEDVRA